MKKIFTLLVFVLFFQMLVFGQQATRYSLFKPVPVDSMRDMDTDRPNFTESPITLDAGHFQYEADLFRFETQTLEGSKTGTMFFNQSNLKLGLTSSTTLQVVVQSFARQSEKDLQTKERKVSKGFGDVTLRIKQNLLGNNDGKFAIAVIPYLKFPTARYVEEDRYEIGLAVPMRLKLPKDWKLEMQLAADRLKDDEVNALHTQFSQSVNISHSIIKNVDGLAESYYTYNFKSHELANFVNAALQFSLSKNFKLDTGVNYGIQAAAERNYFIGASFRI